MKRWMGLISNYWQLMVLALAVFLFLTGCGGGGGTSPVAPPSPPF
ncbi:MAG: hypothetical protein PHO05_04885 [bacterium]|nr:hypothetical protein [bacterium]MDD3804866.1 hypothetical protein [bacterium]